MITMNKIIIFSWTMFSVLETNAQSEEEGSWFVNNPGSYYASIINAMLIAFAFISIGTLACCVRAKTNDFQKIVQREEEENIKVEMDEETPLKMIDVNQVQYQSFNALIEDKNSDGYESL